MYILHSVCRVLADKMDADRFNRYEEVRVRVRVKVRVRVSVPGASYLHTV